MNSAVSGVPFETRQAASSDPDPQPENRALRDAAAQLEAVFLQSLFDEMAKTVETSDLFPEAPGREMYQQWFRKEVAQDFAKAGGVGLSDMIHAQLADAPDPMGRVRDLQHRLQPDSVPKGADGAGALGPSALGLSPPSGGPSQRRRRGRAGGIPGPKPVLGDGGGGRGGPEPGRLRQSGTRGRLPVLVRPLVGGSGAGGSLGIGRPTGGRKRQYGPLDRSPPALWALPQRRACGSPPTHSRPVRITSLMEGSSGFDRGLSPDPRRLAQKNDIRSSSSRRPRR